MSNIVEIQPTVISSLSKIDQAKQAARDATAEAIADLLAIKRALLAKYRQIEEAGIDISTEHLVNVAEIVKEAGTTGIFLEKLTILFTDAETLRKVLKNLHEQEKLIEITRPKNCGNQRLVKFIPRQ